MANFEPLPLDTRIKGPQNPCMGGRAGLNSVEFRLKIEKVAAGSRKLHQEKLYKIL
jgi:hypothetical protein